MSYTVVLDEAERDRRIENLLNQCKRHCRIGKVMMKRKYSTPPKQSSPFGWLDPAADDWFRLKVVPTYASNGTGPRP